MTNQVIPFGNVNVPVPQMNADFAAKIAAQWQQAAALATNAPNRITFKSNRFNISKGGGEPVQLSELTLDVHIVAVNPQFHYVFYDRTYDESEKTGVAPKTLSRYPLPDEKFDSPPPAGFVQRNYRQRAIVMLANDPQHELYVVDFGYKSVRQSGNANVGTCSFATLLKTMGDFQASHGIMPFTFTVQLSFDGSQSVPVVAFSLYDLRNRSNEVRFASEPAIQAMVEAMTNGTTDRLLDIHFDNTTENATVNAAPPQQTQMQVPPQGQVQPPQMQPQMQPQGQQPPAWQQQAQFQPQMQQPQGQQQTPPWQQQAQFQPQMQPQNEQTAPAGMAAL